MSPHDGGLLEAVVAALAVVIVGILSFFGGRLNGKAAFINAVQQAAHFVIVDLQVERADLRVQCAAVKLLHETCESRLDALEARNRALKTEIDDLMSGRVAAWGEEAPK